MPDIHGSKLPLDAWLDAASKKQPTPGGGSAAAVAGALGAAIGEMTLSYSVGRKANTPQQEELLTKHLQELGKARALLLCLMEEDQMAYGNLTDARKLPDSDATRTQRVETATAAAIAVPQAIMATGLRVLEHAQAVVADANKWLLSDLAVCSELALAAVRCGSWNVRANLSGVSSDEASRLTREVDDQIIRGVELIHSVLAGIEARNV